MAKYPEIQTKMRKEVDDQIGDRLVMQEDKSNCHYVNAFISETLRLRVVAPIGVPHKAICDTEISEKQF
jgi:cytochrome P450 family 2 subfamily U polypeptide 1